MLYINSILLYRSLINHSSYLSLILDKILPLLEEWVPQEQAVGAVLPTGQ